MSLLFKKNSASRWIKRAKWFSAFESVPASYFSFQTSWTRYPDATRDQNQPLRSSGLEHTAIQFINNSLDGVAGRSRAGAGMGGPAGDVRGICREPATHPLSFPLREVK